eukprot:7894675-Pyramimonas_sp.AAC.1
MVAERGHGSEARSWYTYKSGVNVVRPDQFRGQVSDSLPAYQQDDSECVKAAQQASRDAMAYCLDEQERAGNQELSTEHAMLMMLRVIARESRR